MWTFWTTVVVFAVALGQFFFRGPNWDRYAIGVLILAGTGFVVLLCGRKALCASRRATKAEQQEVQPQGEGEEAARQRITRAQKRLGELRAGHSWCKTLP